MQELKLRSITAWCSHLQCPIVLQLKGLLQTQEPLRSGPMQLSLHYRFTASTVCLLLHCWICALLAVCEQFSWVLAFGSMPDA